MAAPHFAPVPVGTKKAKKIDMGLRLLSITALGSAQAPAAFKNTPYNHHYTHQIKL
jgi:hypothetical protein